MAAIGNRTRLVILVLLIALLAVGGFMVVSSAGTKTITGKFGISYSGYESIPLLVGLNDASGFFTGNPIYLSPPDKQVLGSYTGNASSGKYTLNLPGNPGAQPFDLTGGKNPSNKVEIFEVRLMSDVASKGTMRENEDAIASSLKISVDEQVEGGLMLVWAADAQEQFPGDYGPDQHLFTADDPRSPLPAGWSLVNLDSKPFTVAPVDNKPLDLTTTGVGDVVDYSQLSCAAMIPALLDRTVAGEAGRLIGTHDAAILQPLALYLGTWKAETSRQLLRRLVADGTVREQAEICLRWIGEAAGQ